jgi:hypothetical protein
MISFNYEIDFKLEQTENVAIWISETILEECHKEGEIN